MEKEIDYLRKYFYAPVFEKPFLVPLSKTPITPNQLTTITLILAVLISAFIMSNQAQLIFFSGFLLILRNGLDCLDGKLARTKNMQTDWGHKLDAFCDKFTELTISAAMLFTLFNRGAAPSQLTLLILLLLLGMGMRFCSKYLKNYFLMTDRARQNSFKKSLKPLNHITRSILWRLSIVALALIFDQLALGLLIYCVINILYSMRESLPYEEWWMTT